jgi:hypothetical protein
MCFLFKQPSELPRVLCASQCPPHNVVHEMNDYPLYYDPAYFPESFQTIFDSEDSVCEWLLMGLKEHSLCGCSCVPLEHGFEEFEDNVRYVAPMFEIRFCSVQIQVPILYIESSLFSFCRLHHLLLQLKSKLSCVYVRSGENAMYAEAVVFDAPPWLFQTDEEISMSLSALSVSQLHYVTQKLCISSLRRKIDFIQAIINDFRYERCQFRETLSCRMRPWTFIISHHFQDRYGDVVFYALRDSRSCQIFKNHDCVVDGLDGFRDILWLSENLNTMSSKLGSVSKDDILHVLQNIPSHLRPSYNFRTVRGCRSVLLGHIRSRISFLASLSMRNFYEVCFSVLPFHADYCLSRGAVTEQILNVEYGDIIISQLQLPSKNVTRSFERRQLQKESIINENSHRVEEICSAWPTVVSDDIVFQCLESYRLHTIWDPVVVCCVCGLECANVVEHVLSGT